MTDPFRLRYATLDDIPVITHQRHEMFAAMGTGTPQSRAQMNERFPAWLREKMEMGDYIGFLAEDPAGQVVSGAGLWLLPWPPGPLDLTPRRAYILNVFTEPAYRGRGLARRLVQASLDYARDHGLVTALLHASDEGRPIYAAMGFTDSNEMRYLIPRERS